MQEVVGAFTRRLDFTHAKDWYKPDNPSRNYGHIGVKMTFSLKGPKGAVHWVISPSWYVESTRQMWLRMERERMEREPAKNKPDAWDIGYHSPEPRYEGQKPMQECCHILGGTCYYDGSSLQAEKLIEGFLSGGEEWLWLKLEDYYRYTFEDAPYPDFAPKYEPHPDDVQVLQ